MEAAPEYWQTPGGAERDVYVSAPDGAQVPLSAIATLRADRTRRSAVNHQGQFAASTISFNLPAGVSLSQATRAIDDAMHAHRRAGDDPRQLPGHARARSRRRWRASRC